MLLLLALDYGERKQMEGEQSNARIHTHHIQRDIEMCVGTFLFLFGQIPV